MSITCTVYERCPQCEAEVPVVLEGRNAGSTDGRLVISLEPDLTDLVAHAWTHDLE